MVHPEAFGEEPMLQADHVVVGVARELHPEAVARLGRRPVADAVGQDDVVLRRVEKLAGAEQLVGELRLQELCSASTRAVQDQDRVAHDALGVLLGRAQRPIVQPHLLERLPAREAHVPRDPRPFPGSQALPRGLARRCERSETDEEPEGARNSELPPLHAGPTFQYTA